MEYIRQSKPRMLGIITAVAIIVGGIAYVAYIKKKKKKEVFGVTVNDQIEGNKVTFPSLGPYNEVFEEMARDLGYEPVNMPITQKTIKTGVRHSSDMVCFTGDTLITTTAFKSKPIKDVKKEDLVLTHKGRFRRVIEKMEREYDNDIINLSCGGLLRFSVTPEHPVLYVDKNCLKTKNLIPTFIEAHKLKERDYLAIPIPKKTIESHLFKSPIKYNNTHKHKNQEIAINEDTMRLLGYWLAEGSIIYNNGKNRQKSPAGLSFVFSSQEMDYIEDVVAICKKYFNCSVTTRYGNERKTATEILVYSKSLADAFLYLCNEKCDKKEIAQDLLYLDTNLQKSLLKGFFRGDGHFNQEKKDTRYTLATVSDSLANQVFWLLIRNHMKPEFSERHQKNRKVGYFIRLWKGYIKEFENVGIDKIRNTYQHCIRTENYIFVPIRKIEKTKFQGLVYNLTVEEDNSYVANYMAVHNCFPFKVSLGNLIEGLDNGATNILVPGIGRNNTPQFCRFLYFFHIQEKILRNLGYDFNIHYIYEGEFISSLKRINPDLSYIDIFKTMKKAKKKIDEIEDDKFKFEENDINIGLIGETYTLWENRINYDIVNKLKKMGCGVDMSVPLSHFLKDKYGKRKFAMPEGAEKKALEYFPKRIGGHGWESIVHTIDYANRGFDGVIHLLPLSCMPESTVEMSLNFVSKDYDIPVYRFPIDENRFEAGFDTRLETFIKLLKRNKKEKGK